MTGPAFQKTVLKVDGLYKKFCRNLRRSMMYGLKDLVRGVFGLNSASGHLRKDEFWALEDVSFELKEKEVLGIVGANGSGKSTLLRVLTGIYPPDRGRVWMEGRVGGIIALGAGMHPHMTGRENIFLNATILGMKREEIESSFEAIVAFAELGEFLDAPLASYSSGMQVRLGFAVAIHCRPDILLIDEVLAVGDARFRNKCMAALTDYRKDAKAVIFISHDLDQIRTLCTRLMVMQHGKCLHMGDVTEGLLLYEQLMERPEGGGNTSRMIHLPEFVSVHGAEAATVSSTPSSAVFSVSIAMDSQMDECVTALIFVKKPGEYWPVLYNELPVTLRKGPLTLTFTIESPLKTGVYDVYFHLKHPDNEILLTQNQFPALLMLQSNPDYDIGFIHATVHHVVENRTDVLS